MIFSCNDRPSVSNLMKNGNKMIDFDRFIYTQSKSGSDANQSGEYTILIENPVWTLGQFTVVVILSAASEKFQSCSIDRRVGIY